MEDSIKSFEKLGWKITPFFFLALLAACSAGSSGPAAAPGQANFAAGPTFDVGSPTNSGEWDGGGAKKSDKDSAPPKDDNKKISILTYHWKKESTNDADPNQAYNLSVEGTLKGVDAFSGNDEDFCKEGQVVRIVEPTQLGYVDAVLEKDSVTHAYFFKGKFHGLSDEKFLDVYNHGRFNFYLSRKDGVAPEDVGEVKTCPDKSCVAASDWIPEIYEAMHSIAPPPGTGGNCDKPYGCGDFERPPGPLKIPGKSAP